MRSQMRRKKNKKKRIILSVTAVIVVLFAVLYVFQANYYRTRFFPKTIANQVNISEYTVRQAEQALLKQANQNNFVLLENGQLWKEIPKRDLGIKYDFTADLEQLQAKQNPYLWLPACFKAKKIHLKDSSLDNKSLETALAHLTDELNELNKGRTISTDAKLTLVNDHYEITPEVQGNNLDVGKIIASIKSALNKGQQTIELEKFQTPVKITKDDPNLKNIVQKSNDIIKQPVQYMIAGQTVDVPVEKRSEWLELSNDTGEVKFNRAKILEFVKNLGAEYNTSTNPTEFNSTTKGTVTVPAGTYGWSIATEAETNKLISELQAGQGVKRTPIVEGSTQADHPLIGNTYVEVDMTSQHMYFYKNGELVLDTDIVTGKPTTPTPHGVFYIWKKERNSVLRGTNDDGSPYASPVDYWMPIDWTGVGLHDSPWQPAYGGSLWQTVGSHGCVNTPPELAGKLFETVDVGTPVIIF